MQLVVGSTGNMRNIFANLFSIFRGVKKPWLRHNLVEKVSMDPLTQANYENSTPELCRS